MNSPADIYGTIACLKLSAHVFPGVNFVIFYLNQDLNVSKFFGFLLRDFIPLSDDTNCVWPCLNYSEPKCKRLSLQLASAIAGTSTLLEIILNFFTNQFI